MVKQIFFCKSRIPSGSKWGNTGGGAQLDALACGGPTFL